LEYGLDLEYSFNEFLKGFGLSSEIAHIIWLPLPMLLVLVAAVVGVGLGAREGVGAGIAAGTGVGVAEALQATANANNAAARPINCRRRSTNGDGSLILMNSL